VSSPATRHDLLETTITELADRLPVRLSRGRDGLLREAHDGLLDAAEAYEQQGHPPEEAARRAVADFGDLDELAAVYSDNAVRDQARWTSTVLTAGYLLMLGAWAVLDLTTPQGSEPGVRDWAASSFGAIGALAAVVTASVLVAARREARRGGGAAALAWVTGAAGVACAVATLVASYLVQPWGVRPARSLHDSAWTGPVEVLSAVVTLGILALSSRCLRSALRLGQRRRHGRARSTAA
jgi:hypothetical protein